MAMHNLPHQGEFVRETYLEPFDISTRSLAENLDNAPSTLARVVAEHSAVRSEMALRLSKASCRSLESWLAMQDNYDLWQAKNSSDLSKVRKIRLAVARDLWKEPDTILAPDERVSIEAAIRTVTINAAWQCHSEHEIGSLKPGKLADFVVLEEDPRKVEPTAISDIGVSETWLDGERVFGG